VGVGLGSGDDDGVGVGIGQKMQLAAILTCGGLPAAEKIEISPPTQLFGVTRIHSS
jgi:hypothetical protein